MAEIRFALDKGSVRKYDDDGRLHVRVANISMAAVNPYMGAEIPGSEDKGWDQKKVYQLLRDPAEIEKAAATCNNMPLMIEHVATTPEDPQKEKVVGSTGTDAVFKKPYLQNSLVVWDAIAIAGIESGDQRELSCGYRYVCDFTPGTYEGVAYDGVMREISFNHLAIVENARCGPTVSVGDSALAVQGNTGSDVVVGDSQLETSMSRKFTLSRKAAMAKGALAVFLKPKLAQDSKIDLNPILDGVTHANWAKKKVGIAEAIKVSAKGKMAKDANLADLMKLLDMLDSSDNDGTDEDLGPDKDDDGVNDPEGTEEGAEDEDEEASDADPDKDDDGAEPEKAEDDEVDEDSLISKLEALIAHLKGGKREEHAEDEPPAFPGKPKAPTSQKEKPMGLPDKAAMDKAISAAVHASEVKTAKKMNDIAEAKELVRPFVGELKIAFDSAEAVYKMALDARDVDLTDTPASAYKAMVRMLSKNQATPTTVTKLAHDSAAVSSFAARFPTAGKVAQLG